MRFEPLFYFLIALFLLPFTLKGQTIVLKNKKETKTVTLDVFRIVEIEVNNRYYYKGNTIAGTDSSITMQTRIRRDWKWKDTLVTADFDNITEIVYCTKEDSLICEPEKEHYIPITYLTGTIFDLVIITKKLNPNLGYIPLTAFVTVGIIYQCTKPKTYNLVLRWKVDKNST